MRILVCQHCESVVEYSHDEKLSVFYTTCCENAGCHTINKEDNSVVATTPPLVQFGK